MEYNDNWLTTEYNTAVNQAFSGREWVNIKANAEALPLLKYVTVGDGLVRASHRELDGIIRPVNDPFWREYYPPNDWNCRCTVEQLEEGEEPVTELQNRKLTDIPPLFQMNTGEDKVIFDETAHPYFKVSEKYKVQLGNNFDLPFNPQVK